MVSFATTSEHKSVAANKDRVSVIKEKIGKYKKQKKRYQLSVIPGKIPS